MRTYTQEEKQAVIDRFMSGEPSANILTDTAYPRVLFMAGSVRTVGRKKLTNARQ